MLTPREHLYFYGKLKLNLSKKKLKQRVEDILVNLELTNCADTYVGDVLNKRISGGEEKRLCIGIELIGNPVILFLDEPTTGLDSYSAELCLKMIKKLAVSGRIVITVVH